MINLELKYYEMGPFDDGISVSYQRVFNIDYLSINREIEISEIEFKTILYSGSIKLCDNTYQIVSKEFRIGMDANCWVLTVQSIGEIQDRSEQEYEDLPF